MEERKWTAEEVKAAKEKIENDLWWEKRQKKIILICSAVCCGLGLIIGVVATSGNDVMAGIFWGIWIGTGIGGAIGYFPTIPHVFVQAMREEGFGEALKNTLIGIFFFLIIFSLLGPIGLLIRVLRMNYRIKKFEKQLSGFELVQHIQNNN